jgi:hypothetical protein
VVGNYSKRQIDLKESASCSLRPVRSIQRGVLDRLGDVLGLRVSGGFKSGRRAWKLSGFGRGR